MRNAVRCQSHLPESRDESDILENGASLHLFLFVRCERRRKRVSGRSVGIAVPRRAKVAAIARASRSSSKENEWLRMQMS
jgi:hypothetical protein